MQPTILIPLIRTTATTITTVWRSVALLLFGVKFVYVVVPFPELLVIGDVYFVHRFVYGVVTALAVLRFSVAAVVTCAISNAISVDCVRTVAVVISGAVQNQRSTCV